MKIQYAIDGALGEGIRVAHKIEEYVDIIEVGDGVLQRESLRAITLLKQVFPDKKILADLKLMDGGYTLGKEAYALGADIVTVCAAADPDCIAGLVRAAQEVGKESWVDLIGIEPVRAAVPGRTGHLCPQGRHPPGRQGGVCAQARAVGRADDGIPAGDPGMLPAPCQPGRCAYPRQGPGAHCQSFF